MEELVNYISKIAPSSHLIRACKMHLLSADDFLVFKEFKDDWRLNLKISMEYDVLYDKLYIGSYNLVPDDYKRMFLILSFYKAIAILKYKSNGITDLMEAIRILDVGIMIGCGLEECALITEFTQKVHDYAVKTHGIRLSESKVFDVQTSSSSPPDGHCDLAILEKPAIEHFYTNYLFLHRPVKMTKCMEHWAALCKWKDINYLIKTAGFRIVPIELGKTYDDEKWGQSLLRLGDFLDTFVRDEKDELHASRVKGYLAQHDLFEQIPALKSDFSTPEYCAISPSEPIVKSWIGPENTVSTMHTDDKHNLLCQVVGEKLIILAGPEESENLYAYEGMLHNTSQVDAENVDYEQFPLARNVKLLRVVLRAGDMVYIPKMWWHYCRSLTKSISLSFWFNIDENDL